jgi:glycosyltransferase involved in cell wall biosynthesis
MHKKEIKKILLFTSHLFPSTGGFSQVIDALAGGMGTFGFSTQLLAPIKEDTPPPPYPVIPLRFPHSLYPLITDYRSRYERIMELNLEILYQKDPYDMIHAHIAYPAGFCAARWGRQKGIPVIITCHGHDIKNFADKPYEPDIWEKLQAKMIEGFALADAVTVPSRDMLEQLKSWGVNTHHIPNGVKSPRITPHPKVSRLF